MHGGEILLSQATCALLEDEEHDSADFMLVDLGEQSLKDFERPVRIFRLLDARPRGCPVGTGRDDGCIRVLIVDDQALVRAGFRMILDSQENIEVIGEASDGQRSRVDEALRLRPNVVLMDVRMPDARRYRGDPDPARPRRHRTRRSSC